MKTRDAMLRNVRDRERHYRGCNCRHCRLHGEDRRRQLRRARRRLKRAGWEE